MSEGVGFEGPEGFAGQLAERPLGEVLGEDVPVGLAGELAFVVEDDLFEECAVGRG